MAGTKCGVSVTSDGSRVHPNCPQQQQRFTFASKCTLPTQSGTYEMRVYENASASVEAIAMVVRGRHARPTALGTHPRDVSAKALGPVLMRVQDQCVTSEVFGSLKCDCKQQLDLSMERIQSMARMLWEPLRSHSEGCLSSSSSVDIVDGLSTRSVASFANATAEADSEESDTRRERDVAGETACSGCIRRAGRQTPPQLCNAVSAHDKDTLPQIANDTHLDCGAILDDAVAVRDAIVGLVLYLQQEGRGVGIAAKVRAYALQEDAFDESACSRCCVPCMCDQRDSLDGDAASSKDRAYTAASPKLRRGLDTVDANRALGLPDDSREYSAVRDILLDLQLMSECKGVEVATDALQEAHSAGAHSASEVEAASVTRAASLRPIILLTNNPRKLDQLREMGIPIAGREPCVAAAVGPLAARYMRSKAERMGHDIPRHAFDSFPA